MPTLRAAFLTAIGVGLIALAVVGIADRDAQARLERALGPTAPIQAVSRVTAFPLAPSPTGR
ncbi:hypothetical protein VQ03_12315 [Methylobacterium tarhaniae]|uniref:Uncharacterized protein n=1 Tax=Methylobacterium tarhaniae TaxID=1187852 RepID=A0A0J6T838_9HYPH|nr:hypothetical protein [Methylobacterium tarhaniae]KMO41748.1 hypothetical protein VQ03_12315 [Methylobacterium tarhaniae]